MKTIKMTVIFLITVLLLSSCNGTIIEAPMDVLLTDKQISAVEAFLTYPAGVKTTGVPCVSIYIFGTKYTTSPTLEIYAWELSEDLYRDDIGNISADGGSSCSIIIEAEINGGNLTVIGITTPPSEGGGYIFPEYLQPLENSSEPVLTQLHEKNVKKAEKYYEAFSDSEFHLHEKYESFTLILNGISKEYTREDEPKTATLIATLIDDRKEGIYIEMPSKGVIEISIKYSDGNIQSIYLWTEDGTTFATPLPYENQGDWKPGGEFTWTFGNSNAFEEVAALIY